MSAPTAAALAAALRARRVSALELAEQAIARTEAHDTALNAVVVRDFERAREQARAADAALARGERAPLLGVPMTVKESFHVAGLPTTWGVAEAARTPARSDAVAVQRLKRAGAVILGKTNVSTHLGDWQSDNAVYGRSANPWDLARTPGGSSGGAAAALAAGYVPLELGSDLAGSLRVPAHFCGVHAHKPSLGLVPGRGHTPPGAPELSIAVEGDLGVVGPMARSAADLRLALELLAGPDDAQALAYRLALPAPRRAALADYRVLLVTEHPRTALAAEVGDAIEAFAARLQGQGCRVERASPLLPDLGAIADTYLVLLMAFLGANWPPAHYRGVQERAAALPADSPDGRRLRACVASHREWLAAHRQRTALSDRWRSLFQTWDLVLCPVAPVVAFAHDNREMDARRLVFDGRSEPYGAMAAWAGPATASGLPATALPVGLARSGLPVGVQAIGPYLEDLTPLHFAQCVEEAFGACPVAPGYA